MHPPLDFGFCKVNVEPLDDKSKAIIEAADRMSQSGWELKALIEIQPGSYTLFFQRPQLPVQTTLP